MSKKKWIGTAATFLGIAFLMNAASSLFVDPMEGLYPEIKRRSGYDKQDLVCLSGGYSRNLLGRSANAEFQIQGDQRKVIRISIRKPLHLVPWQVHEYRADL